MKYFHELHPLCTLLAPRQTNLVGACDACTPVGRDHLGIIILTLFLQDISTLFTCRGFTEVWQWRLRYNVRVETPNRTNSVKYCNVRKVGMVRWVL